MSLSSLKYERRELNNKIDQIENEISKLTECKENIATLSDKTQKIFSAQRYWKGPYYTQFQSALEGHISREKALINQIESAISNAQSKVSEYESEVSSLTYQINHWKN